MPKWLTSVDVGTESWRWTFLAEHGGGVPSWLLGWDFSNGNCRLTFLAEHDRIQLHTGAAGRLGSPRCWTPRRARPTPGNGSCGSHRLPWLEFSWSLSWVSSTRRSTANHPHPADINFLQPYLRRHFHEKTYWLRFATECPTVPDIQQVPKWPVEMPLGFMPPLPSPFARCCFSPFRSPRLPVARVGQSRCKCLHSSQRQHFVKSSPTTMISASSL